MGHADHVARGRPHPGDHPVHPPADVGDVLTVRAAVVGTGPTRAAPVLISAVVIPS